MITLAIFLSGVIGYGLVEYVDHGWQYLQAGIIFPSLMMVVCHKHVPESPKWLIQQGRREVRDSMIMIYGIL